MPLASGNAIEHTKQHNLNCLSIITPSCNGHDRRNHLLACLRLSEDHGQPFTSQRKASQQPRGIAAPSPERWPKLVISPPDTRRRTLARLVSRRSAFAAGPPSQRLRNGHAENLPAYRIRSRAAIQRTGFPGPACYLRTCDLRSLPTPSIHHVGFVITTYSHHIQSIIWQPRSYSSLARRAFRV